MSISYRITEEINAQVILWALVSLIHSCIKPVCWLVMQATGVAEAIIVAGKTLVLSAVIVGAMVVAATNPVAVVCLASVLLAGCITYPR